MTSDEIASKYDRATVADAIALARTREGRTFGAWIRRLPSLEAAQAMLDQAGIVRQEGRRSGHGATAEILRQPGGDIDIIIRAADEPETWVTGPGGYLHPGDRPDV
jgi:hypothetical protein